MTTFTSDDRKTAYDPGMGCIVPNTAGDDLKVDLVAEAPYHPGYEDTVPDTQLKLNLSHTENENSLLHRRISELEEELKEYQSYKERHFNTAQRIIDFLKT